MNNQKQTRKSNASQYQEVRELRPAPYFYYIDHSRDVDSEPNALLSPALSVPNFIVKLHAILANDELGDVIAWMPNGRSWKILNQVREN